MFPGLLPVPIGFPRVARIAGCQVCSVHSPRVTTVCRIYSLGRLMESAYHNLGRIRLIWGRLWAAVAPHLVSAACHTDSNIAALAVDHMRRLIAKLLARAELSHFTYQASPRSPPDQPKP